MRQALSSPKQSQQSVLRPPRAAGCHDKTTEHEADRVGDRLAQGHSLAGTLGTGNSPSRSPAFSAQVSGQGAPLPAATRAYFEPRMGHDLSGVRVHTGSDAASAAERLDAHAFTAGRDIAFGLGDFSPHSSEGRRLIGHELAHVVRDGGAGGLHLKAKSIRFQDEPTLDEVSDGKKVLKKGDSGDAVIRIAQALSELGFYLISIIDERFDHVVEWAVSDFQAARGLKGIAPAGEVDKQTFDAIDGEFVSGHKVERDLIAKQVSGGLLTGTDPLNAQEKLAANRAISTDVRANAAGVLPTFKKEIPGKGKYEDRLFDLVELIIIAEFNAMGRGKEADHADATKLYDWSQIDVIAKAAQAEVDAVFKQYYGGASFPALAQGTNIFDAWDDKVATLKAGGWAERTAAADWRVEKIITGDDTVMALDAEHGAVQERGPEKAIIARVQRKLARKHRRKLLETHKGWPGYADNGKIFIQRFKGATQDKQRSDMWEYFQTFIHEYIHTIEVKAHRDYRATLTEKKGNKTLREGVTDYLTKIVWDGIKIDAALRAKIEGPFHDPLHDIAIPDLNTYGEAENAERLAGIVGIRNLLAAFFLGKTDFVGGP